MSTRLISLAGALVGSLLGLLMVIGTLRGQPLLTVIGAALLGVAVLMVQVDTWRRVRSQRNFLRDEIRRVRTAGSHGSSGDAGPVSDEMRTATPAWAPPAAQEDILGAVRLLQAQYTGRLDRMQRSLEDGLAQHSVRRREHDGQ